MESTDTIKFMTVRGLTVEAKFIAQSGSTKVWIADELVIRTDMNDHVIDIASIWNAFIPSY